MIDPKPGRRVVAFLSRSAVAAGLVADTSVTDMPTAEQVAYIAIEAARAEAIRYDRGSP